MTEDKLFKNYLDKEKKGFAEFIKNPKSWVIILTALAAVVLVIYFYKSVILEGMSSEEVKNSIEIVWHDSKWVDKKVTPQEVKIVPSLTLQIKNVGERPLQYVDLEVVFEIEETGAVFDDGMARILKEPLQPGEISKKIFVKSSFGYSASSRSAFIQNKEGWKKMQARVLARAKGSGLVKVGDIYPIKQEIEGLNQEIEEKKIEDYSDENTRQLARSVQIVEQDSIWVDKARTGNQVIIVPSITIKVKNIGQEPLQHLYIMGTFKYEDTGEILSEGLAQALKKPLAPGDISEPILVRAEYGYTATSKAAFIENNEKWKTMKVNLYAKRKESQKALLGIYPIKQKIEGIKVVIH
jgi:hypothetical protein